jgi:hypothetical protein
MIHLSYDQFAMIIYRLASEIHEEHRKEMERVWEDIDNLIVERDNLRREVSQLTHKEDSGGDP